MTRSNLWTRNCLTCLTHLSCHYDMLMLPACLLNPAACPTSSSAAPLYHWMTAETLCRMQNMCPVVPRICRWLVTSRNHFVDTTAGPSLAEVGNHFQGSQFVSCNQQNFQGADTFLNLKGHTTHQFLFSVTWPSSTSFLITTRNTEWLLSLVATSKLASPCISLLINLPHDKGIG